MKAEDIKDQKTVQAWLDARPESTRESDAKAIAQRSALRVFPLFGATMMERWARNADLTALPILRLGLTSEVARKVPIPEVINAAADAAAVRAATLDVGAANFAARAAGHALRFVSIDAAAHAAIAGAYLPFEAAQAAALSPGTSGRDVWKELRHDAKML